MSEKTYDVVIVGGGLSGLVVARELHRLSESSRSGGLEWKLFEARQIIGGRVANDNNGDRIDLGAAWIWRPHQPLISQLIGDLGLRTCPQPDEPSSSRVIGGAVQILHRIVDELPPERIKCQFPVSSCKLTQNKDEEPCVALESKSGVCVLARRIVFAVPPNILATQVTFNPPLSHEKHRAMTESMTWMAGVTKVALKYTSRFWPMQGETYQSFHYGLDRPAFQVYDSSTSDGRMTALTFFALVSSGPAARDDSVLAKQCADQLSELWMYMQLPYLATKVKNFYSFHVKRWPFETYISDNPYPARVNPHPNPDINLAKGEWAGMLLFAGSECDLQSPGLMEGAISSAYRVIDEIKESDISL